MEAQNLWSPRIYGPQKKGSVLENKRFEKRTFSIPKTILLDGFGEIKGRAARDLLLLPKPSKRIVFGDESV